MPALLLFGTRFLAFLGLASITDGIGLTGNDKRFPWALFFIALIVVGAIVFFIFKKK